MYHEELDTDSPPQPLEVESLQQRLTGPRGLLLKQLGDEDTTVDIDLNLLPDDNKIDLNYIVFSEPHATQSKTNQTLPQPQPRKGTPETTPPAPQAI